MQCLHVPRHGYLSLPNNNVPFRQQISRFGNGPASPHEAAGVRETNTTSLWVPLPNLNQQPDHHQYGNLPTWQHVQMTSNPPQPRAKKKTPNTTTTRQPPNSACVTGSSTTTSFPITKKVDITAITFFLSPITPCMRGMRALLKPFPVPSTVLLDGGSGPTTTRRQTRSTGPVASPVRHRTGPRVRHAGRRWLAWHLPHGKQAGLVDAEWLISLERCCGKGDDWLVQKEKGRGQQPPASNMASCGVVFFFPFLSFPRCRCWWILLLQGRLGGPRKKIVGHREYRIVAPTLHRARCRPREGDATVPTISLCVCVPLSCRIDREREGEFAVFVLSDLFEDGVSLRAHLASYRNRNRDRNRNHNLTSIGVRVLHALRRQPIRTYVLFCCAAPPLAGC